MATKLQYLVTSIAFVMTVLSFKPLYALETLIIPNVKAIEPLTADRVASSVAEQLPDSESGRAAASLVRSQAVELKSLHDGWLALCDAFLTTTRVQLAAWTVILALSVWQLWAQLRRAKDAA